jgi:chemotaxis protein CheC
MLATEQHRDALVEIVNIGMGQAGDKLARLFGTFIELSIPGVRFVHPKDVIATASPLIAEAAPVVAARQAFSSQMRGEAIAVFDRATCETIEDLMGYPDATRDEAILEVSNLLIGACLTAIASQISRDLTFSPPSILGRGDRLEDALPLDDASWTTALIADVNFRMERRPFRAHLFIFWPDDAIATLDAAVSELVADL